MLQQQLSVFLQNKAGRAAEICRTIGEAGVNIVGFDIADTPEGYGIFRVLVDDPQTALDILHTHGITVTKNDVVVIKLGHTPGTLGKLLSIIANEGLNIDYMYAGADNTLVFHFDKNEHAIRVLTDGGYTVVKQ
ncbi:MAG: ACT domain-containing protein [Spirochaetes bacterium]|nr:ACT domain-containing protein [Spirochaetota bacterium]